MCYRLCICLELADGLKPNITSGPEWQFQENECCLPIKIRNPELLSLPMNLTCKQTVFLWCPVSHLKDPVCANIILHKEEAGRHLSSFSFLLASQWSLLHFLFLFPLPVRFLREVMCILGNPSWSSFSFNFVYSCYFFQHASCFSAKKHLTKALQRE